MEYRQGKGYCLRLWRIRKDKEFFDAKQLALRPGTAIECWVVSRNLFQTIQTLQGRVILEHSLVTAVRTNPDPQPRGYKSSKEKAECSKIHPVGAVHGYQNTGKRQSRLFAA
ncbi:predicted protein [Uncinocarpus reesii 1704]|uniref:Uncharacterized protein n=1 Tax=Uncinocarpus reesii (strain UAMH 1704) TaxID=336963 RepID=C4JVJ5_UNCRE|nr:uncharacterized protein UREG_06587 [Uncinocarpus reesii 1704]EEP81722.1 predicted protein [Uncinocarpus reesii 1704]